MIVFALPAIVAMVLFGLAALWEETRHARLKRAARKQVRA